MNFIYEDRDRVHHYIFTYRDNSWVQPWFNRLINNRLLVLLPSGWSPNIITFTGHILAGLAFVLICLEYFGFKLPLSHATTVTVAGILFFIYCICDSLDGMYARYWKVATPLGDFYDHWLDCFVGFSIPVGIFLVLKASVYFLGALVLMDN